METIDITIPTEWLGDRSPNPDELREALQLGLAELDQRHRQRVRRALIAAGLSKSIAASRSISSLSPERRKELAERFAAGGPLSDLIIEDRADRI